MAENMQKKPSRVLAALEGSPPHFNAQQRSETTLNALKRKGTPNYESLAQSSAKKRASSSQHGVGVNRAEAEGELCLKVLG
jgi:hypothetical protein